MKIRQAEFIAAARTPNAIPAATAPEVAVAGRSNVGKSSLINRLAHRKKLARTSSTPGCTRGLIFYDFDDVVRIVDLPGYGWAKRSQAERELWKELVEHYLSDRPTLKGVLILFDIRRGPEQEELDLAEYLASIEIPYAWVATKADKLKQSKLAQRRRELAEDFQDIPFVESSSTTGRGMTDVWRWMQEVIAARR